MFIGHFALGFAAKRAAPRTSLATLFAAAQLADILWPVFVALGIEQVRIQPGITAFTPLDFISYPYSHSLLLLLVWGALFGALCATSTRNRRTWLVVGGLVVSHWVLDWITHRPDMPLYPGSARFGLGLWNSVPATIAVEIPMFVAGLWIYARATRARDAIGRRGFSALAGFLLVIYVANAIGPPPPSVTAIVVAGVAGAAVIVLWAWWFDRHRSPVV
jgi:membrane-bound metal-dependent hydrolase YbcI (DUF457 family)